MAESGTQRAETKGEPQWSEEGLEKAFEWVVSGLLAAFLAFAPIGLAWLTHGSIEHWVPVYVAGALGGLVLELIGSRGQIEIPGPAKPTSKGAESRDERRPLLPQIDLGVCARLISGGLAAVAVVMLGAAVFGDAGLTVEQALTKAAHSDQSIAWALVVGASSSAAWQTLKAMAQKRFDVLAATLASAYEALGDTQSLVDDHLSSELAADELAPSIRLSDADEALRGFPFDPNPDITLIMGHLRAASAPADSGSRRKLSEVSGALRASRAHIAAIARRVGINLR
jgi:hypothetical protein